MAQATLTIDLGAICVNWRRLNDLSSTETGAVVKADAYGLGAGRVAQALAQAGARTFFVAQAQEGAVVRSALGPGPRIFVFGGHMEGDAALLESHRLTPLLNSIDQMLRHVESLPGAPFGVQLDSGMNRLGMEPDEWAALRELALSQRPALVMSHLACADEPDHAMNGQQLAAFRAMTDGVGAPRSLAATGGTLLGAPFHFEMTRPGVGLYGGHPFVEAATVVQLDLPIIQVRNVEPGESVGYGNAYIAKAPRKIATLSAGYADGLIRAMGPTATLWHEDTPCPVVGRVSMDLITVDVSALTDMPETLEILGPYQSVDDLADCAGTIGYEILTSLGARYARAYLDP